jgi:hypothetical protein
LTIGGSPIRQWPLALACQIFCFPAALQNIDEAARNSLLARACDSNAQQKLEAEPAPAINWAFSDEPQHK